MNVTASPIHVSSAMTYSSTYKGSGRGYVHMTSSAQVRSIGSAGGGMAQAPVASMSSTSSSYSRGIAQTSSSIATPQLSCIRTSASAISGGVTTYDNGPRNGRVRKIHLPGTCEHCDWEWDDEKDDYVCIYCGSELMNGCECGDCHCPIGDGKDVWLFVTALAGVYALYKARARKEQLI